ncbi:MAG TPA: ester cyclase [Propionibacteriaceae bacterium]|nr:ester cyclase [Propionibacteriaceae bacterium]
MDATSNKDVVRRIYEDLVNGQRLDLLEDYFSPDYANHKMPGGREGTRQLFVVLFAAFPDVQVSIDSMCGEEDRVWVRITMRGTHRGMFMGMPGTGKTFAATTLNEVRLEDGKVVEEWGVTDTLAMMQQLGLLPEATS